MATSISLKSTIVSLIESIDLSNYILKNHHRRVSIIAHSLGKEYGLTDDQLCNLVLASSLHDIGALTVADQIQLTEIDTIAPRKHEVIGSIMLKSFSPFEYISDIVLHHHIRWAEVGVDYSSDEIPIESYFLHLADRIEILTDPDKPLLMQKDNITQTINHYGNDLFAPFALRTFNTLVDHEAFWFNIEHMSYSQLLIEIINDSDEIELDDSSLEDLALLFSRIVDFRSHFTASHSIAVGSVAYELSRLMGLPHETSLKLKIAGYLHDIGKIGIPTELLEKNGRLTQDEYDIVKLHSYYTYTILSKIKGFEEISTWASRHHEKHDQSGYPFHLGDAELSIEIDILAYSDIFTSLCEDRPYREGIHKEKVLKILASYAPVQLSAKVYHFVAKYFNLLDQVRKNSHYNLEDSYLAAMDSLDLC